MFLINYYQLYISPYFNSFKLFINNNEYKNKNAENINNLINENRCKIINNNPTNYIYQFQNINNNFQNLNVIKTDNNNKLFLKIYYGSDNSDTSDNSSIQSDDSYKTRESNNDYSSLISFDDSDNESEIEFEYDSDLDSLILIDNSEIEHCDIINNAIFNDKYEYIYNKKIKFKKYKKFSYLDYPFYNQYNNIK